MRNPIILLALALAAILGAMAAKSLLVEPPALRERSAPGEFDARRAKAALAAVLGEEQPHPADSQASDGVRERLVAQLRAIGLSPIVRDQIACNELHKQRGVSCARVRNVIAVLGPTRGTALLLNAHYDSSVAGPGAGDDGIGVATLIEVGRLLRAERLGRPVILLFNEGEELGLVGARAFLADPLSRSVDALINLEARGVRGPVNMFETSRPNAAPIALYRKTAERPFANSLSTDVYRTMPNYTDVNSFAERGWLTLNLAPIGNETRYHSAGDNLEALDPATLQHMGDQTLALARELAGGTPRSVGGDQIFMDLAGRNLLTMPLIAGALLMAGLMLGLGAVALRRGGGLRAVAVVVGTIAGSTAIAWLALALLGAMRQGMFWRAEPVWTHLGAYASAMLAGVLLLATFGQSLHVRQLRPIFWLAMLLVGAMIGIAAPGGIVFFLLPTLVALAGIAVSRWWAPAETIASALAILFLYLSWGAMLALLEELMNGGPMWLFAPLGSLIVLPMLIEAKRLIDRTRFGASALLAGLTALAAWGAAAAAPAYSADRQQRFVIQHVTDASAGKAWWSVLNDGAPLPAGFGTDWKRGKLPISDRLRWLGRAPANPAATAPGVEKLSELRSGGERTLTLRLMANGNERIELILPPDSRLRSAGLPGAVRPIDQSENGKYFVTCFGRSCDGLTLQLVIGRGEPVEMIALGGQTPLPALAGPLVAARPANARPQYARDEAIAFARTRL